MEKVTKNARIADLESKLIVMQIQINSLIECSHSHTKRLIALEPDNPNLKKLTQSVFNGLDEKWRFAAVVADGRAMYFNKRPYDASEEVGFFVFTGDYRSKFAGENYDTSNWQNSLIERDIAKELLEVDLSSELTGSDLARALKNRNEWVLVYVSDENDATAEFHQRPAIVTGATGDGRFKCGDTAWRYAVPINNQGEPLTASEVGL